ncbi:transcriptional regulator, TetR family [Shimia gijangensis]|uniref:Transcriptional regulator, TetR family n=1 Tax=Shimia gijangensis TaxID=1470563 RepID=A0A1M6MFG7_9RHOB|nr:TetR/AcrR family transcriptional regulator [Shimia gijangensis]SHJ82113.1 transcriptional regulator, TetR family [Shimia gijangensis]
MTSALPRVPKPEKRDRYEELLVAAAECFQKQGFSATSIDTVARYLGATKGRVYHYFPSKMDLFNAVRDRAMALAFDAIRPGYESDLPPVEKLAAMSTGHVKAMMQHHSYMQVLLDGLQMQRFGATTEFQRAAMERHLGERNAFEACFREVLQAGCDAGDLKLGRMSYILQSYLVALNGPVFWYRPREGDDDEKYATIAEDVVRFALAGVGVAEFPILSIRS